MITVADDRLAVVAAAAVARLCETSPLIGLSIDRSGRAAKKWAPADIRY